MSEFLSAVQSPTEAEMFDSLRSRGRLKATFVVRTPDGTVEVPLSITGLEAGLNDGDRWRFASRIWRNDASRQLVKLVDLSLPLLPEDWRMVYVNGVFVQGGERNFLELSASRP